MFEISFNEIVRVNILNDELNNTTNKAHNRIKIKRIEEKNNTHKKSPRNKVNVKYNIKKHF